MGSSLASMSETTSPGFPALLAAQLKVNPGRPFLTWYDDATGERVELSVTTYANWVLKTANLLIDEYDLDEGDTVLLDLPNHWLTPVFLGAAWYAGIAVTTDPLTAHDLVVCGPDHAEHRDADAGGTVPVLACSLLPFAVRFPEPPPQGVDDYGLLWPGQPDSYLGSSVPTPRTELWHGDGPGTRADDDARWHPDWEGSRLLTDESLLAIPGLLLRALARSASLVLVHRPSEQTWRSRADAENVTAVRRAAAVDRPGQLTSE